jgi:signal transduction histidine kinase
MSRMSFALKLMLTLALTVLVAVGTVAVLVNMSADQHFQDYVWMERRPQLLTLVPTLQEHYEAQRNWAGVEDVLSSAMPGGMGMARRQGRGSAQVGMENSGLMVADAQGRVVVDPTGEAQGQRLSARVLGRSLPIESGGRIVGYLVTSSGSSEQAFIEGLNRSILLAGAAASLVTILLGVLLTRTVVRPLRVVRDAARRIGLRDLAYRVPVTSDDEVGDLARQFNDMAAALERDEELRKRMMADIAHELRTPLAVIRGQVEALQDGVFELTPGSITPIHDQVLLLGRLVDDLRDLALAEAGRLPLEVDQVDTGGLISRVVASFQSQVHAKQVRLGIEVAAALPVVCADAQRLEQVLANLLSNALRHTPEGGSIEVKAWGEGQDVLFAVTDSGPGIASEDLPFVFDRFYRGDRSRSRTDGGAGLGLAITRQIVEAHGGQISVLSPPRQGASFTVRLPAGGRDAPEQDRARGSAK